MTLFRRPGTVTPYFNLENWVKAAVMAVKATLKTHICGSDLSEREDVETRSRIRSEM
jgi:hypothetical protein